MRKHYDIEVETLGPDEGQHQDIKVLTRSLRWTSKGIDYELDRRHADLIARA